MDWIKDNAALLSELFVLAYGLARVIVALTPTKKDDKAFEDLGPFLTTIAVIFGLNPKQGLKKK